jgi:hypothetical protein
MSKIGTIEIEGTGLTNGHPPIIISGKIKSGTVSKVNGLLTLKNTGEFEAYDFNEPGGNACISLDEITAETTAARVLLHGTFSADKAVKADGSAMSALELAFIQLNSQIYFV